MDHLVEAKGTTGIDFFALNSDFSIESQSSTTICGLLVSGFAFAPGHR